MGSYAPQTPCAPRAAKHPLRVCSAPRSLKYPRRKEVPPIDFCHIPVSIIKRSEGRSAVAAAAYRSGTKLTNEWDGLTHDYTRKGGVVHAEIMLPAHAPPEFADRSILWNSVEQIEKARDIYTDEKWLTFILSQIVQNAIKYFDKQENKLRYTVKTMVQIYCL